MSMQIELFLDTQLWKLNGDLLHNKEGLWISGDKWNFKPKGDYFFIENISNKTVWGTGSNGEVIQENFKEDKNEQLWKKGELNDEGYFTLENIKVPKVITAINSSRLEIKGNILTLRWIKPTLQK